MYFFIKYNTLKGGIMKKIKEIINKNKVYIYSFLTILILLTITLVLKNIFPFGNNTLAKGDANSQFLPMLYNFIEKLKTGTLESYSFNNGLGAASIFNYVYYLSSPINLLCLLFKNPNTMFTFLLVIRLCITAILSTFYFKKKSNNTFIAYLCSITYTFSGWFLTYYFCNIWIDIFMIFPLFQYGLEKLIKENKCKLYIFSLAYIIISNFYLSFMICLYTLIYYLINTILKKDKYINKIKNFQIIMYSTIITFLLCTFHIFLVYKTFTKMSILINDNSLQYIISPLNIISSIFYGQTLLCLKPTTISTPNICLNTLFTMSTIYFFVNKNINTKEKMKTLLSFVIITIAIISPTLNFIIHGFHTPIGLTYRYSFIISFYFIYIFIKNFKSFNKKIDKKIFIINLILLTLLIYLYNKNIVSLEVFMLNIFTIISYTIFFIFYNNNRLYKYIIILITLIESFVALQINITTKKINFIEEEKFSTNLHYREIVNKKNNDRNNKNLYYNKNTITMFTTMNYKNINEALNSFGIYTDYTSTLLANKNTNTFNMIFNIKTDNNPYLEKIFATGDEITKYKFTNSPIDNQQNLIKLSTGISENIFKKLDYKQINNNKYTYKITQSGNYILLPTSYFRYKIIKDNKEIYDNKTFIENVLDILYFEKGTLIEIETPQENTKPLIIYYEDTDTLNKAHNILKDNQINYTHYSDSHMEGTINIEKNQVIFTSIPYDESWKITIDGKETKPIKLLGNLLGIECNEGTHTIKLEYKINYTIPAIISITTLIGLIIHSLIKRKDTKLTI